MVVPVSSAVFPLFSFAGRKKDAYCSREGGLELWRGKLANLRGKTNPWKRSGGPDAEL